MYRNIFFNDENEDENSFNEDSSEEDFDQKYENNNSRELEDDLLNKIKNLELSDEENSINKRNKRIFKNRKSFSESELDYLLWEKIKEHTEEKIELYINLFQSRDSLGPFEKGASFQSRKGRIDNKMKYDTSTKDGLKYCVDQKIKLNNCTNIDAAHIQGIKTKSKFDDDLNQKLAKTNPLPSCFNNGPEKTLENFLTELINETENSSNFEKKRANFFVKLNNKDYPDEIKKLYKNEIGKICYSNGKMYYKN